MLINENYIASFQFQYEEKFLLLTPSNAGLR